MQNNRHCSTAHCKTSYSSVKCRLNANRNHKNQKNRMQFFFTRNSTHWNITDSHFSWKFFDLGAQNLNPIQLLVFVFFPFLHFSNLLIIEYMDQLTDHLNWTNIVDYHGLSIWKGKASAIQEGTKSTYLVFNILRSVRLWDQISDLQIALAEITSRKINNKKVSSIFQRERLLSEKVLISEWVWIC